MAMRTATDKEMIRVRFLQVVMLLMLMFVSAMLWRLQVAHGARYQNDVSRQSIRRVRLPGTRGSIYDRYGCPLVENRPGYEIVLYLEELRQSGPWSNTINRVQQVIDEVSARVGVGSSITRDDIWNHIKKRLPLPLHGWLDMDDTALARWAEQTAGIPAIDIYTQPVRVYPYGDSASHLLGYVGRATPVIEDEGYDYYLTEFEGKSGLERSFDQQLRGTSGGYLMRVDVTGYRYEDKELDSRRREPKIGHDIHLAIDVRMQMAAEKALGDVVGAMVLMDPRNGDILAMANSPRYDPNSFVPSISFATWQRLMDDVRHPLVNRATMGGYAPGSTFKPVIALAALENNRSTLATRFNCPGYFKLGKSRFNCWYHPGHGELDVKAALKHSCNVYFYHLGLQCGHEYICHMAQAMGFGQRTGIDIAESRGLLPTAAWKRNTLHDSWRKGDTCNLSIGQGALLVSPLRMAVTVSAIANGGKILRPRLVLGVGTPNSSDYTSVPVEVINDMHWRDENIEAIREGMREVVMSAHGTGRRARVPGVEIAGKTGTAEYGPAAEGKKNTWMIAFAPYDHPRYALAALVEDGKSGGSTVAPRVAELFDAIFNRIEIEGGRS